MGSNAVNLDEEDLCCPVCRKPLSCPGKPPRPKLSKFGRGNKNRTPNFNNIIQSQRDTRMAIGKLKDNEDVVVAQCGHLFHKFCLRHYCYLVREGRANHLCKVTCPWCDRRISMSFQTIDYRAHQDRVIDRDKDLTKINIMNNELTGQMKSVQQKLQNAKDSIEDGNHNFELYRTHWRKLRKELKYIKSKRLEIESMYSEIERSEKMLKCMQSQQLKIVKKFVSKVKEKQPKDFIHFPRRLAPFLHFIEEDDRLVRDLGEIIVPIHLNHLKSDRQSLLKGIIATVQERMLAEGKSIEPAPAAAKAPSVENNNKQQQVKARNEQLKKPAFYVKVRKSSISILSSTTLTRESIQQIIETINIPLPGSRIRNGSGSRTNKVTLVEHLSNNRVENVSASDIKILYMPKRKVIEQYSEPCRISEESESYVNVPARKCKSTDAILMKTIKKKGTTSCRKASLSPKKSTIVKKRSSSAAVMSTKLDNIKDDLISFKSETTLPSVDVPEKKNFTIPSAVNDEQPEVQEKANETDGDDDKSKHLETNVASSANPEIKLWPKIIQSSYSVSDTSSNAPEPTKITSVLKLIYDNLEKEHKTTHALESYKDKIEWVDVDENNNNINNKVPECILRKAVFPICKTSVSSESQPAPKFFRVDRRGVARPESPHSTKLRQPTFLPNFEDTNHTSDKLTHGLQPDEENQLHALSSDDKLAILSEHETNLSSRKNCANSVRRPMFHGTPACLGMPDTQFQYYGTPPDPKIVPYYLKKWQEQLVSPKILKAQQRFNAVNTAPFQSTRLLSSPKATYASRCSAIHSYPQAVSPYQRQTETFPSSGKSIHLPPLFMYPVKRPATAQCDNDNMPGSYGTDHRQGPELDIPRIYDDNSMWKYA